MTAQRVRLVSTYVAGVYLSGMLAIAARSLVLIY